MSYRPARNTTINYWGRPTQRGSRAPGPRRASSTPLCPQGCAGEPWHCNKAAGRDQQRPGPDPPEDAHAVSGSILPFPVPAWGPRSHGPPVGSRGAATSRRVCPQAKRRAGEEPWPLQPRSARPQSSSPHGAQRPATPRCAAPPLTCLLRCPGSDAPHQPPDQKPTRPRASHDD